MTESVAILGSTGSIGTQALEVCEAHNIKIKSLAAAKNIDLLEKQTRRFCPESVAVLDDGKAKLLKISLADTQTKVYSGFDGIKYIAAENSADTVLNSIVGIAGLVPTLEAIKAKKTIALANKETLVAGGDLVKKAIKENGVNLYPVDSEHSAIFQCLQGKADNKIHKILLTASGGPFFGKSKEELKYVTPENALKHPNWNMGAKITIDSSTLMNKGLEVIEAVHLFDVKPEQIEVVVHRQSVVHSAVEFDDGAVIAQLGVPDMRLPIQYALTYPNRFHCPEKPLDLFKIGKLTFDKPDYNTFSCLNTCINAIKKGGLKPCAANGANEQAVALFLSNKIPYLKIAELVEAAANAQKNVSSFTLEDVLNADLAAREFVLSSI